MTKELDRLCKRFKKEFKADSLFVMVLKRGNAEAWGEATGLDRWRIPILLRDAVRDMEKSLAKHKSGIEGWEEEKEE